MRFACLALAFLTACLTEGDELLATDLQPVTSARSAWDGTPEGAGALALLNSGETDVDMLDFDVPLDERAALNLVGHRDGPDARFGTKDDNPYGSITEVDSVRWVGPRSIEKIIDFADAAGLVPSGAEHLGSWDGVDFSVDEAELTLDLVNDASEEELDVDLALDRRAVDSILDARPLYTVDELAGLYFVGTYALNQLKGGATGEAEEAVPCTPILTPVRDPAAEGFSALMAAATTVDSPWSEALAYELSNCEGWATSAVDQAALNAALFNATYVWSFGAEMERLTEFSPLVEGGNDFAADVYLSLDVIEEFIADGDWDPTASSANAELYKAREGWVNDLTSDPLSNSGDYREVRTLVDMSECSEQSTSIIQLSTGRVWILHRHANC